MGSRFSAGLRGSVLLALILLGYLVILVVSTVQHGDAVWMRLVMTNLWLAGASLLTWWRRPMELTLLRESRRAWLVVAVVVAGLVLLWPYVIWWPGRTGELNFGQALVLVLLVPVAEELYFRGVLLDHLRGQMGTVGAVLPVCALFGFLHYPQGLQWVMAGLSLVLCAVVLLSRSLAWAVALHVLWNAAAMIRTTLPGGERWALAAVATVAVLGLGVAGFLLRDREAPPIVIPRPLFGRRRDG